MEKKKTASRKTDNDFYKDLDEKTKFSGNCSCWGMVVLLIVSGIIIFFIFSYFYLNK